MKNGIPWCLSCYQPLCLPVSSSLSALVFWSHIINCDACHTEDLYMACKSVQVSSRGIVPRTHGCWSNPWTFKFWIKHCFTTEDACPWWELWMQRVGVETSVCNMYVSPQPLQSRLLRSVWPRGGLCFFWFFFNVRPVLKMKQNLKLPNFGVSTRALTAFLPPNFATYSTSTSTWFVGLINYTSKSCSLQLIILLGWQISGT